MQINWHDLVIYAPVVSAAMAACSVTVVAVTAWVAVRQLKNSTAQINQLRRATQLDGTMKIFGMLGESEQQRSRRFIESELEARLSDPAFRAEIPLGRLTPDVHLEIATLRLMEMVGMYIKHGMLDRSIVFDYWFPAIIDMWERLEKGGVISAHRAATGPTQWENFEKLYRGAKQWQAKNDPDSATRSGGAAPEPAAGTKS